MEIETLYRHATKQMQDIIEKMLSVAEETNNFTNPSDAIWNNEEASILLLCGKGFHLSEIPEDPKDKANSWLGRLAISFSLERSASSLLYQKIQPFINDLVFDSFSQTESFTKVTPEWIFENPQFLPVLMHAIGAFSKRDLEKELGTSSLSDNGLSRPTCVKLASKFSEVRDYPSEIQILERMKSTTEGIVRDLIGRLLLEDFVAQALRKEKIPFLRESEYESLSGIVYDFRADFVIPDSENPKAFIEVRKSSAGHASLYAKDKMFSAINWKGKHKECLGFVIVEGPWTQATLEVMAKVFDYVIPVEKSYEAAKKIREYLDGDISVLRWLIQFRIDPNN